VRERIVEKRSWHEEFAERFHAAFAGPGLAWAVPLVIVVLLGLLSLIPLEPRTATKQLYDRRIY
jgi:hypothetical protein